MIGEITNHLWQSTAFAGGAGLLTVLLRSNRAHVRYWVWFAASVKFLVPCSVLMALGAGLAWSHVPAPIVASTAPAVSWVMEPFTQADSADAPPAPSRSAAATAWISDAALGIWSCGVAAIVLLRLRAWQRVRAAIRTSAPYALAGNVDGVQRTVPVRSSPGLLEPGIVGFWRPILLVPAGIADRLTPDQLDAVLAHEICHVRRRDNLTSAIHMLVESIVWFHPAVWWIGRRLLAERERACDEHVLQLFGESQTYAEGILNVCKLYVESPLACVSGVTGLVPSRWFGGRGESDLKRRIEDIMSNRIGFALSPGRRAALFASAIAALAVPVVGGMVTASAAALAAAQTNPAAAGGETFEIASIRPCDSKSVPPGARGGGAGPGISPGRLNLNCQVVKGLIQAAYVMFPNGVRATPGAVFRTPIEGGPDWISSERYSIEAKAAGTPGREAMQGPMLQALLEDRFKLKIHRETREVRVYALMVGKSGKLKPHEEGSCVPPVMTFPPSPQPQLAPGERRCARLVTMEGPNRAFNVEGVTVAEFVDSYLSGPFTPFTGIAHVVDRTGLTGKFDFHVVSAPPPGDPGVQNLIDRGTDPGEPTAPELPTALQEQLGFKLQPSRGPGEFIVIDHIERPTPDGPPVTVAWPPAPTGARGSR